MSGSDSMPVTGRPGAAQPTVPTAGARLQGVRPTAEVRGDSAIAAEVCAFIAVGDQEAARERFEALVRLHQRRASRIAFHYLRDAAEADEATQDAFVKAFLHIESYRPEHAFEVWFTRILVNGCLDRPKARQRTETWQLAG